MGWAWQHATFLQAVLMALTQTQVQTASEVYSELQRTLSKARSIKVVTWPTTGNSWDRETTYVFRRPDKAYISGWGFYFRTNGRWTLDSERGRVGRAMPGDAQILPLGFEAFGGRANVARPRGWDAPGGQGIMTPIGIARDVRWGKRPLRAIDLDSPRLGRVTLFIDPKTGLPVGWGDDRKAAEDPYFFVNPACKVTLNVPAEPYEFNVPEPLPAEKVVSGSNRVLRMARRLYVTVEHRDSKGRPLRRSLIEARKPFDFQRAVYRRGTLLKTVVYDGKRWVLKLPDKPPRPLPGGNANMPRLPGLEEFWGLKPLGKIDRIAQPVFWNSYLCYRVRYDGPGSSQTIVYYQTETAWRKPELRLIGYELLKEGKLIDVGKYEVTARR